MEVDPSKDILVLCHGKEHKTLTIPNPERVVMVDINKKSSPDFVLNLSTIDRRLLPYQHFSTVYLVSCPLTYNLIFDLSAHGKYQLKLNGYFLKNIAYLLKPGGELIINNLVKTVKKNPPQLEFVIKGMIQYGFKLKEHTHRKLYPHPFPFLVSIFTIGTPYSSLVDYLVCSKRLELFEKIDPIRNLLIEYESSLDVSEKAATVLFYDLRGERARGKEYATIVKFNGKLMKSFAPSYDLKTNQTILPIYWVVHIPAIVNFLMKTN